MHAWYSGFMSEKPNFWTSDFRLAFIGDCVASVGDSILNWIFFLDSGFLRLCFLARGFQVRWPRKVGDFVPFFSLARLIRQLVLFSFGLTV